MSDRFEAIDAAIRRAPDSAENYLLRGELLLERGRRGDDMAAAVDLYRAMMLADRASAEADWGISAQITRDQARILLDELAERGIVIEIAPPEPTPVEDVLETPPEPYPLAADSTADETGTHEDASFDNFENVPPDGTMQAK